MSVLTPIPSLATVREAAGRIAPYVHCTPVMTCRALDELAGAELHFKCENFQRGGAFKMRGASNAVFGLDEASAARGVVTHSSGNHAGALALAARTRGIPAFVVMPHTAPEVKKRAVAGYGAKITEVEPTTEARLAACAKIAAETGAEVVPPFDDVRIVAGQGTVALELAEQCPGLDVVITPAGGGGLLSGTALAYAELAPQTAVYGAEAAAADTTTRALQGGGPVPAGNPTTWADGLRTGVSELTYGIIAEHAAGAVAVSEEVMIQAMRTTWERMKIVVEASASVALGAVLTRPDWFAGKRIGLVLTGGNVDLGRLPW